MPRPTKPKGPTEVTAYDHDDTRRNIPTADAAATFYDEAGDTLPPLRYPRNPDLDPQLVWKGKDAQDGEDLIVDAPPIYIQEKVVPRALIDNLREQSKSRSGDELPSLFDFDDFDSLDDLSAVEFYQHDESWKNRMVLGDSLQVMGSLAERESLRGKVQMVYIDPPYGIKFGSNWQVRASKNKVSDGKLTDAAREAEQIKAFRDTWAFGIHSYLSYLRDRLVVARDLLADSGSVFVQIGDENVHLVRSLLDEVFGRENFMTMITVQKTTGAGGGQGAENSFQSVCDYVLWHAKDKARVKSRELFIRKIFGGDGARNYRQLELADGTSRAVSPEEFAGSVALPEGSRAYTSSDLTSDSGVDTTRFPLELDGRTFLPGAKVWKTGAQGMARLLAARRVIAPANTPRYKRYYDDFPMMDLTNNWTDMTGGVSDKIYVVQTNVRVVERCMLMCTDPGDLVLDPTCGSGTTAFVAEHWGRRWITIDTSRVALSLARQRIMAARFPYFLLADSDEGRKAEGLPPAGSHANVARGFVYKKVQHVTLRSIANNPEIREGMTTGEINAAINKHAEFELLYDQPVEDRTRVRVAGPFTVESLSPHRSIALDRSTELRDESVGVDSDSFEQTILSNLRAAGIQNGRKKERLVFDSLDAHPGAFIQGIGSRRDSGEQVAITIGPQYGTVSAPFIKQAAREAVETGVPLLAVLGFAFDPNLGVESDDEGLAVVAGVRDLGKVKVLIVRMNVDLLMGEELKKTGSGNLFTVFGEPDLDLRESGDQWVVQVRGVDVYDPTSGDVRSNSTKEIALWMVDTDYDGESFFVRHAYFLGDNDPFKSLKTALKADIDPDAWSTLYRAESVPFDTPSTGRIAVKVINDYGDEVMKVLEVGSP
ncbi:MAG: site-specific DNA-methyltransferase [Microcella sp.]